MSDSRGGFTLIEVVVALAIAGIVVLSAHAVFAATTDSARTVRESRLALDRETNARRWLAAAWLSLEAGRVAGDGFEGRPAAVTFTSWMQVPAGWSEPRRVALGVIDRRFVAVVAQGDTIALADSVRAVRFDYLLVPGENTRWATEWISPVSAPLAVRVRLRREPGVGKREPVDTMLFLVKERG